jgi:glucokinase
MDVLSLDIGGTNTRIALVEIDKYPIIKKEKSLLTKKVKSVSSLINSFNSKKLEVAGIGFAGPIMSHKAKLTNADLSINSAEIKKNTSLKNIYLINDYYAIGVGSKFMKKSDLHVINQGSGFRNNVSMTIGAGTGLGKSLIIENKVYPCEPGGTTLTIENIDDYALFDFSKQNI